MDATKALQELVAGNRRFVSGESTVEALSKEKQAHLVGGQKPFAIVIGCADSRVPVEHIFDQGFGELFVIRVAGNVASPEVIGSVEYAVEHLDTRLVAVLGHTNCGAVGATLEALKSNATVESPNLDSIVQRIQPAVAELLKTEFADDPAKLIQHAVRANVHASVGQLKTGSQLLEQLSEQGELKIVGAEYSLETGEVDFFEGMD